MGSELHGNNRKNGNFHLNIKASETLNYLCNGLKKKYGVYPPMSKEDCKIIARILRNKGNLLKILAGDKSHCLQKYANFYMTAFQKKPDWMTDKETTDWILKLADWFDNCGGLRVPYYEEGEEE
jgi:hypothetical protein